MNKLEKHLERLRLLYWPLGPSLPERVRRLAALAATTSAPVRR